MWQLDISSEAPLILMLKSGWEHNEYVIFFKTSEECFVDAASLHWELLPLSSGLMQWGITKRQRWAKDKETRLSAITMHFDFIFRFFLVKFLSWNQTSCITYLYLCSRVYFSSVLMTHIIIFISMNLFLLCAVTLKAESPWPKISTALNSQVCKMTWFPNCKFNLTYIRNVLRNTVFVLFLHFIAPIYQKEEICPSERLFTLLVC